MRNAKSSRRIALVSAMAMIGGISLLAPPTPAHAAIKFEVTSLTGLPAKVSLPTSGSVEKKLRLVFSDEPDPAGNTYYSAYSSTTGGAPTVDTVRSLVKSPYKPSVSSTPASSAMAPGAALSYTVRISAYTSPGRYRVTIPVTRAAWNGSETVRTVASKAVEFEVTASAKGTLAQSSFYGSGKLSKKAKWSWRYYGPDYLKGATIKVYFKAKGKKKYTVVATGKVNSSGDAKFKGKKGAIRKTGSAYFVISAVSYTVKTKSKTFKVKKA